MNLFRREVTGANSLNHSTNHSVGEERKLPLNEVSFYHKVVAKGYPVQADLTQRPWGMVDFRIMDLDGYYLRITSRDRL